jgi:hypothetical protein
MNRIINRRRAARDYEAAIEASDRKWAVLFRCIEEEGERQDLLARKQAEPSRETEPQ